MQNSIQMVDNLVNAGKQFDLMLYPRKTHGIAGPAARTNLFTKMLEHWDQWLKGRTAS
jgi:dipeptidyl-peptidase-4